MEQKDREELERFFAGVTLKPAASEQEIKERKESILGGYIKIDNAGSFLRTYFAAREFLREHLDEAEVERTLPSNVFHETMYTLFHLNVPQEDFYRFDRFARKLPEPVKKLDWQSRYRMQEEYFKNFSECRSRSELDEAFRNARENIACYYGREEVDKVLSWDLMKKDGRFMNEVALPVYLSEEAGRSTSVCVNDFLRKRLKDIASKLFISIKALNTSEDRKFLSIEITPSLIIQRERDTKNAAKIFNSALLGIIKDANRKYGTDLIVIRDVSNALRWKVYLRKEASLDDLFEGFEQE